MRSRCALYRRRRSYRLGDAALRLSAARVCRDRHCVEVGQANTQEEPKHEQAYRAVSRRVSLSRESQLPGGSQSTGRACCARNARWQCTEPHGGCSQVPGSTLRALHAGPPKLPLTPGGCPPAMHGFSLDPDLDSSPAKPQPAAENRRELLPRSGRSGCMQHHHDTAARPPAQGRHTAQQASTSGCWSGGWRATG
jgi:hypothetical protein